MNICSHQFVFVLRRKTDVHNLLLHRQSVLNVQQDFTVLALWMLTQGMCLGLTLPCCVRKDIIAHQVGKRSAAIITHTTHDKRHSVIISWLHM